MKNRKFLFSLQLLTTIPPLLFIIVYAHSNAAYMVLALILLILISVNTYRYLKKLSLVRYPLLLVLSISFLLYAFQGLGSKEAPQTFQTLKRGNIVTFSFPKPSKIDKVCYYVGIDKTVNFYLSGQEKLRWEKFYTYDKNFPFSFRWRCADVHLTASNVRLFVSKNEMMLGEVRFFDHGKVIPFKANRPYLNDEPKMGVDTSYFGGMFFDEIYHGRTAYELLHGLQVYETTHPYLGKLLIVPGIELFGMTPYGWRFVNVLFGTLLVVAAFYLGKIIFAKRIFAFTAAFLMTYSFMHLTQSRMALIDTFGVFFVMLSYYFLYRFIVRQKLSFLLISGVMFGLASAVKWAAVFSALGFVFIAVYLFVSRYPLQKRFSGFRLLLYGFLSYGVIAVLVYTVSFYDIYLHTGSFQAIIDYQVNMFKYHSALKSAHPYSSAWWSWPIDYRPMCYYRKIHDGLFSSVTAFGNPAIFWTGTASLLYLVYVVIKRHTLQAAFILLAFLGLYLPYIFIGRQMFIYHFYYAVPFMMLAVVYALRDAIKWRPWVRKYFLLYLALTAGLFLMFYPVLSGYEVPKVYVDYGLKWFPGWWL